MSVHLEAFFADRSNALARSVEVMVLSRDAALITDVEAALEGAGRVHHARRPGLAIDVLNARHVGVLITDAANERSPFRSLARQLRGQFPRLVIIGVGSRESAVTLIELVNGGQVDRVLLRPLSISEVRRQVSSAIRQHLHGAAGPADGPEDLAEEYEDNTEPQAGACVAAPEPDASMRLPAVFRPRAALAAGRRRPLLLIGGGLIVAVAAAIAAALSGNVQIALPDLLHRKAPAAVAEAAEQKEPAGLQAALAAAARALREGRYLLPAGDNALAHLRAALAIDPQNRPATAGMETITGVLLVQAQTALRQDDTESALAARDQARELRPGHSAIPFVDAEFASYGRRLIERAENEPADLARAEAQIALAARLLPPGAPELPAAHTWLAEQREQLALDERLALVDERMQSDRLTVPEDDSARFHLLALRARYPENTEVADRLEHLADRLLEMTDRSIHDDHLDAASRWLQLADGLGVRTDELAARHVRLESTQRKAAAAALLSEEAAFTEAALNEEFEETAAALSEASAKRTPPQALPEEPAPVEQVQVASNTKVVLDAPAAGEGANIAPAPVEVSELEAVHMMPPEYPRRAYVRDIDGWIDLEFTVTETGATRAIEVTGGKTRAWFERAAIEAVQRWQFKPELQEGRPVERRAKVRLQFTPDQ